MGLLFELRASVQREVEAGTGLGPEVEAALFGYADEVTRLADARAKAAASAGTPVVPVDVAS